MKYVVWPHERHRYDEMGAKAGTLCQLHGEEWVIPEWFVLSPRALDDSGSQGETRTGTLRASEAVRAELREALGRLSPDGHPVAVRSSAAAEDGAAASFAGQLTSCLFVAPDDVADATVAVWESAFAPSVRAYRRLHGLSEPSRAPAVMIQRMVRADVAGIAFGIDPVNGGGGIIITAVRGMGDALAAGHVDGDRYRVSNTLEIIERSCTSGPQGNEPEPFSPALTDAQVLQVARLTQALGHRRGAPQDVEWAFEQGGLYLIQTRPVTGADAPGAPAGDRRIWDSSNIAESYSGMTTPLTFSFARRAYEHVYRRFCALLGVPPQTIDDQRAVFANMLGFIRGRVFYNLLNWYRVLALLPGFASNREFMEQMMGVREALPADVATRLSATTRGGRWRDALRLARSGATLVVHYLRLPKTIASFRARLDRALRAPEPPIEQRNLDGLVAHYRRLEAQLLSRWDAPILNDFFAMIFFGVLGRLTARWCEDGSGQLRNALLVGDGKTMSTEPVRRVRELARLATRRPQLVRYLCDSPRTAVAAQLDAFPELAAAISGYIGTFGDRCLDELKLESPTLNDDPLPLYRAIGRMARALDDGVLDAADGARRTRAAAERSALRHLRWRPDRRIVFAWVLRQARARVRDRETLRFERTRVFGRARRIFLAVGHHLRAERRLDEPTDVFFLDVNEILGFVEGTATTTELRSLVALRRAEFRSYETASPPPRFETVGSMYRTTPVSERGAHVADGDTRLGIGTSVGTARGLARVVRDPRTETVQPGEVLVASRTDPGWVLLFATAAGIVVEHGSLLSHAAIVARELGLPAVIGVRGATEWLSTGDIVEVDGRAGIVRRLPSATAE